MLTAKRASDMYLYIDTYNNNIYMSIFDGFEEEWNKKRNRFDSILDNRDKKRTERTHTQRER